MAANAYIFASGLLLVLALIGALFQFLSSIVRLRDGRFEGVTSTTLWTRPLNLLFMKALDHESRREKRTAIVWLLILVFAAMCTSQWFRWYAKEVRANQPKELIIRPQG